MRVLFGPLRFIRKDQPTDEPIAKYILGVRDNVDLEAIRTLQNAGATLPGLQAALAAATQQCCTASPRRSVKLSTTHTPTTEDLFSRTRRKVIKVESKLASAEMRAKTVKPKGGSAYRSKRTFLGIRCRKACRYSGKRDSPAYQSLFK